MGGAAVGVKPGCAAVGCCSPRAKDTTKHIGMNGATKQPLNKLFNGARAGFFSEGLQRLVVHSEC